MNFGEHCFVVVENSATTSHPVPSPCNWGSVVTPLSSMGGAGGKGTGDIEKRRLLCGYTYCELSKVGISQVISWREWPFQLWALYRKCKNRAPIPPSGVVTPLQECGHTTFLPVYGIATSDRRHGRPIVFVTIRVQNNCTFTFAYVPMFSRLTQQLCYEHPCPNPVERPHQGCGYTTFPPATGSVHQVRARMTEGAYSQLSNTEWVYTHIVTRLWASMAQSSAATPPGVWLHHFPPGTGSVHQTRAWMTMEPIVN